MTRRNPNAGPSKARYDWTGAEALIAAGATGAELARSVGCSTVAALAWAKRRGIRLAIKKRSTEELFGCSLEEARRLNGGATLGSPGRPASLYRDSFKAAAKRGIAWEMTFPEWMKVWADAGGLHLRGRRPNDLCMARFGDVGPYRIGNVEIITTRQNAQDGLRNKPRTIPPRKPGYGRGWSLVPRQTLNPYLVGCANQYVGSFPTEEAARAAYLAAAAKHSESDKPSSGGERGGR